MTQKGQKVSGVPEKKVAPVLEKVVSEPVVERAELPPMVKDPEGRAERRAKGRRRSPWSKSQLERSARQREAQVRQEVNLQAAHKARPMALLKERQAAAAEERKQRFEAQRPVLDRLARLKRAGLNKGKWYDVGIPHRQFREKLGYPQLEEGVVADEVAGGDEK